MPCLGWWIQNLVDGYIHNKTIALIVDLLAQLVNDEYDYISYYIWDLDFGKDYKENSVTKDDISFPLSNAEELYDLIMDSQM